ncbi:MAG: hypothetical protein AAGA10_24825 [Bacteroidota bacterium]
MDINPNDIIQILASPNNSSKPWMTAKRISQRLKEEKEKESTPEIIEKKLLEWVKRGELPD